MGSNPTRLTPISKQRERKLKKDRGQTTLGVICVVLGILVAIALVIGLDFVGRPAGGGPLGVEVPAPFAKYAEGFVDDTTGPAQWNNTTKMEEITGTSSFAFTTTH